MLRQLLVGFVQDHLILSVLFNAGFQIVTLNHPCDAAKIPVGIDMGGSPALLIHGEEGLHIAVAAVRKGRNEHIDSSAYPALAQEHGFVYNSSKNDLQKKFGCAASHTTVLQGRQILLCGFIIQEFTNSTTALTHYSDLEQRM